LVGGVEVRAKVTESLCTFILVRL
jgi:hypothetical protein